MGKKFKIDWDEIDSFQDIDPGFYECVVETRGQPAGESASGNPSQTVVLNARVSGEQVVSIRRKFAVNSIYFKELVEATGYKASGEEVFDPDDLHGKRVRAYLSTETNSNTGRSFISVGRIVALNDESVQAGSKAQDSTDDILNRLRGDQASN